MVTYKVAYRDGKAIEGLSYEESLRLFEAAQPTENPCTVTMVPDKPYSPPGL